MPKKAIDIKFNDFLDKTFKQYNEPSLRNDILIIKEKVGYEFNAQQKEYTKKLLGYIFEQAERKAEQNPKYIDKVNNLIDKAEIYLESLNQ